MLAANLHDFVCSELMAVDSSAVTLSEVNGSCTASTTVLALPALQSGWSPCCPCFVTGQGAPNALIIFYHACSLKIRITFRMEPPLFHTFFQKGISFEVIRYLFHIE